MKEVTIKINGKTYTAPEGTTILEAARLNNIDIPTLCFLKEINEIGACRICLTEVEGMNNLVTSCVYPITEGMSIKTNSDRVFKSRKTNLELILSTHERKCLSCIRNGNCELQKLCKAFNVDDEDYYNGENCEYEFDDSSVHMYRNNNKCILCRRCVAVCKKIQSVGVIGANDRGFNTHIGSAYEQDLGDVDCISCGQCIVVCPTGAIAEKDQTQEVWEALQDPTKHVVVQTAPSVRVTLGEAFQLPVGTNVEGKMVAALRRIGFDRVFDTNVAADFTIMEEATEFLQRVENNGPFPMFTSCSPGWVKYCEAYHPELIPNLSSCKSPQQMFGALIKTWYAQKNNIDPEDIFVVGIMPCTAKKFEVTRENQAAAGYTDVDIALTTRELARMIEKVGIRFNELPDETFDQPLGDATGAGYIFGATGGVMEAALRTASETLAGHALEAVDFVEVRGTKGIKEATYEMSGQTVKVAVASGINNAKRLIEQIEKGEAFYHFVEIMACPGGCVNGGGQPVQPGSVRNFVDLQSKRAQALYVEDKGKGLRRSHENPVLQKIYQEFLEKPGSHKAHHILHTSFQNPNLNLIED
ncbi:[FeFe] hydrogenase, group A [Lactococcus chungangensis CAU 28 = DSM 22330]|uniref:NADP-reducing hydrogenase subunit HndD n=1 Tax=Pseudolactococcus chungangensis CAU 28 = DSM 22330 TaxID=1122154 RepID=A0A1K2HDB3_9LACT|nr:NADH-dependent [FeFe] hydrogenase, group A6 [Lactococcus chungangensis]PCS02734.1 [FeFe] hydrogenase, group A [Lactococcus chungangensis CAU 28 = DSM 22330]SFZ74788.1 NADP-reducing hydrogenase subunit HndD [Lactococcus chungangensis CAU 28 = DSM 22330]